MFRLQTLLVSFLVAATTAFALPKLDPGPHTPGQCDSTLVKVKICTDVDWKGYCEIYYTCIGNADISCRKLYPNISSIRPEDGIYCIFYKNTLCNGGKDAKMLRIDNPQARLTDLPGDWNDAIQSFDCYRP
ncbi:hypothetical protein K504DRAFT_456478 [Pleomassaria siparia CBS 279.74]|uniref:Uncharacterized protein n=1 Tax=Pleomassaria siparia CBS 279.74 TaxID=1314801 RepID=A0A6G1K7H6_9PLEO|nr:hypothetical protein K504DRAFT_456478 [Pleomassaria siparia CBS 279.74]